MANRFTLQSDGGIIELQASIDDLLLQSDGVAAGNPIVGVALPDAALPISRTIAVQSQSWVSRGFLGLLNDFTKIFRTPLITPRFVRVQPQYQFATNLLLTTLAVVAPVAAPFTPANATQLDPVRPRASYQQVQFVPNLLLSTLSVPIGKATHEPVPRLRAVQQPDGPLNLLTTTLAVAAPAEPPFTQDDWPNPVRATRTREHGFTQAQIFNTPNPVVGTPFALTDWPNPILKPRQNQGLIASQVFNTADVVTAKPFLQSDWPNPVRPVSAREYGFVQAQVFNTADVVFETPFHQDDWQNPLRVIPRAQTPLMHRYAGEPVIADATKPFLQGDWPNPVRAILAREYGFAQPQIFNTADVPNVKPFLQTEWPNPRVNPTYRQFLNNGRVLGEEPLPFSQSDWPNPLPKPLARQGLLASQIFNTPDVPKPFAQTNWPNPVLAIKVREFGLVQSQIFNTADVADPFFQTNWPNPVLQIARREFGSTSPLTYDRFVLPEVMPAARQLDWPNPVLLIAQREFGSVQSQVFNTADVVVTTRLYTRRIRGNDATGIDDWTINYQV